MSKRARLFLLLSVIVGLVAIAYVVWLVATTEVPGQQGTLNPFGT